MPIIQQLKEKRKITPVVDKEFEYLLKELNFTDNGNGYLKCMIKGKKFYLHRLIMGDREGFEIDHINRNKLDNRKCNLRFVTHRENNFNKGLNKNNTSGMKGVIFNKKTNKWVARICPNKKSIHLGCFINKKDAEKCRKASEVFYKFTITNV